MYKLTLYVMKKNKFKYEPIVQEKQQFWMHSVEKHNFENPVWTFIKVLLMLFATGVLAVLCILWEK